jgi:LmbE family N-acetylglucosaminyl deacetylase
VRGPVGYGCEEGELTKAIAVVAHYDDAVIWAGGAIRRTVSLGWEWTVVCTCAAEEERREYFVRWCESLGARPVALLFVDHPDGGPFSRNAREAVCAAAREVVRRAAPDWVFTHNLDRDGEYGPHPNHTEAAEVVASLAGEGILGVHQIAHFAYRKAFGIADLGPVARSEASHYVQLDYDELRWKAEWCAKANDVEMGDPALGKNTWLRRLGWPCPNPEAFTGTGLRLPAPFVRR